MEQPPPYSSKGPPQPCATHPNAVYPQSGPPPPQQQQPGYPPQPQPGYHPHQQPGYPPQVQGYPPQGYVPQPIGFPSQTTNNTTVVVVGQPQPQVVATVVPVLNDHMALSIFACFCCFWPVGIFAIYKSHMARSRHTSGDYAGAFATAQSARYWAWGAIFCGIILYVIIIAAQSSK